MTGIPTPAMITEVLDAFPGAPVDRDNLSWYQGLLAGELHVNRCRECETWHHPPPALAARTAGPAR